MTRMKPRDPKLSPEEPVDDPETEKSDDGESSEGAIDEHALRHGLEIDDEFEPTLDVPHPPIVKRTRAVTD